jgi:hypothetical protein
MGNQETVLRLLFEYPMDTWEVAIDAAKNDYTYPLRELPIPDILHDSLVSTAVQYRSLNVLRLFLNRDCYNITREQIADDAARVKMVDIMDKI